VFIIPTSTMSGPGEKRRVFKKNEEKGEKEKEGVGGGGESARIFSILFYLFTLSRGDGGKKGKKKRGRGKRKGRGKGGKCDGRIDGFLSAMGAAQTYSAENKREKDLKRRERCPYLRVTTSSSVPRDPWHKKGGEKALLKKGEGGEGKGVEKKVGFYE